MTSGAPQAAIGAGLHANIAATARLAVPLALTQVGQLAMFTTDLALIGRLGDTQLAAAALAHTVLFAAFVAGMGLVSAVAPLTAQGVGARDPQMIRRSLRAGLHASLALGVPMICLQIWCEPVLRMLGQDGEVTRAAAIYLTSLSWSVVPAWFFMAMRGYMSALGAPNPGLWIMLAAIPVNFALAYALIFGFGVIPELGLIGAGLATTIVNVAMCLAAAAVILLVHDLAVHRPLDRVWRPDWVQFRKLLGIGLPISVAFSLEHGLFTAATLFAGAISTTALASHQIALQVASIAFMLPLGVGLAASVRVGEAFGGGNLADVRRSGQAAAILGLGIAGLTTIAVIGFADVIPVIFLGGVRPETADTHALAAALLVYAAAFFFFDAVQTIANGALRGMNDTKIPMLFAATSFWIIGFPASWALAFPAGLGARGIWIGLSLSLFVYAVFLTIRFLSLTKPAPARR